MAKKIIKLGTYRTLVSQLDKLARHNRHGSFQTKTRYYEACKRFCAFLADEFHLQKLTNISGKHLVSYVLYLQDNGLAASTIKGKGGKVRTIPIEDERITTHLKKQLKRTERGQKLLVPDGMPTDRAIHQLQLFIYSNRGDFQEDANRPLTFHGLRHTYAAERSTGS